MTIVIEGVFMYLEEPVIAQLLQSLRRLFPQHKLICDLMTRRFFEEAGRTIHQKLTGMGASFKFTAEDPERLFLENGYELLEKISIIEKAVMYQAPNLPKVALKILLATLPSGYSVDVFATR